MPKTDKKALLFYVRVPELIQEAFIKELKRVRLRKFVLYFPLLVAIGCLLAPLLLLRIEPVTLLHSEKWLENHIAQKDFRSKASVIYILCVATGIIFVLRLLYRDACVYRYLFCPDCDAVDNGDDGVCPVCGKSLTESADFYYVSHDGDEEVVKKFSLTPVKKKDVRLA
jgi:hypothetical protein